MSLLASILLLCAPPIVISVAIGGALSFIRSFRRSFGAHRPLTTPAIVVAVAALLLHAGFFLAPLLLYKSHVEAALWLVTPISVIGSLGLLWVLMMTAGASDKFKRISLVVGGMVVAYFVPVVVLAMHLK